MNARTTIASVLFLIALAAPAARATIPSDHDGAPPPKTTPHAKSTKKVSHHPAVSAKKSSKSSGGVAVKIISSTPPAASQPSSKDCEYTSNCSAEQLCLIWGMYCDSVAAAQPSSVPSVAICPEQAPGDSCGYCITVPSQNDAGTSSTDAVVTSVTYNDGAGT